MEISSSPKMSKFLLLLERYKATRAETSQICSCLEIEDLCIQPCAEVSPPKWHLGHTTWFFEELILVPFLTGYKRFGEQFSLIFNSYYKAAGLHWTQQNRGHLSRPTVAEIYQYREQTDQLIAKLFIDLDLLERGLLNSDLLASQQSIEVAKLIEIGIHHEQQHQELLYMDIKYILHCNPSTPAYFQQQLPASKEVKPSWQRFDSQLTEIGHQGDGYAFDNECPQHKSYLTGFSISETLVTNGEYLQFIEGKGYQQTKYWLSMGWDWVCENNLISPLYWRQVNGQWLEYTLHGLAPIDLNAPVVHVSYFEATAYAQWRQCRLPTEQEYEHFLFHREFAHKELTSTDLQANVFHPNNADAQTHQVWCWTQSHYSAYPGYKPFEGKLEEYNGKFMCNQFVLRGGCIATPSNHYRHTYRNFYQPHQRWMFSGIRLAKD
ncbi:ergothioneine biosynthesis protein EgtB [Shewanella electrodiphila]|uniref:Ergothioneine biosynthesis protein EgtB n=1 Tax=Shewanella electrodiphila TaxID=934143 RepID=A0ABT0KLF6_9GAMM|nr:ergothioneine biosynthesis protein EgtB [Shewanella electrodiphila]MCL1044665.1 ergothioneine biosynthesis protein EgtB [Shewanella electrodiphila]